MTVGERIREVRKQKNMTQKQVAEKCGMKESNFRAYELGKANPKTETLQRIAEALGVSWTVFVEVDSAEWYLTTGEAICRLMEENQVSIERLSRETEIATDKISSICASEHVEISPDELQKICAVLGITKGGLVAFQHFGCFPAVKPLPLGGEYWGALMDAVDDIVYKENLDSLLESFTKLNSKGQEEAVRSVRIIAGNPDFLKEKPRTDAETD